MIDLKQLRQNPEQMILALQKRGFLLDIQTFLFKDQRKRELMSELEEKKTIRNTASRKLGAAKKNGLLGEITSLIEEIHLLNQSITQLEEQISVLVMETEEFLHLIPNPPAACVPVESIIQKGSQNERHFLWDPKTHQEITEDLHLVLPVQSSENGIGTLPVYSGLTARLERDLIHFLLDNFSASGFVEAALHSHSSVISAYQDSILDSSPVRYCAICNPSSLQISLVSILPPENSHNELESMSFLIEKVLALLLIPYRIVLTGAKELDSSAAEGMRIDVWMPGIKRFETEAVCFNHETFLSRDYGVRFRSGQKEKPQHPHMLTCTIDVSRVLFNAILENYQNEDGTVSVPVKLIPYMGAEVIR